MAIIAGRKIERLISTITVAFYAFFLQVALCDPRLLHPLHSLLVFSGRLREFFLLIRKGVTTMYGSPAIFSP